MLDTSMHLPTVRASILFTLSRRNEFFSTQSFYWKAFEKFEKLISITAPKHQQARICSTRHKTQFHKRGRSATFEQCFLFMSLLQKIISQLKLHVMSLATIKTTFYLEQQTTKKKIKLQSPIKVDEEGKLFFFSHRLHQQIAFRRSSLVRFEIVRSSNISYFPSVWQYENYPHFFNTHLEVFHDDASSLLPRLRYEVKELFYYEK